MNSFEIVKGDTQPILSVTLVNNSGAVQDLSGADSVTLILRSQRTDAVVVRDMTIVAPSTSGQVSYEWQPEDWVEIGEGLHYMVYQLDDGETRVTFPNSDRDVLRVHPDLSEE